MVDPATRTPSDEERRFSDELGFFWEDAGGSRMAGRVLGALLLAEPREMSSSDLASFLGVSAASVSTATRELIQPGLAARVRIPGRREDHFVATMGANMSQFARSRMALSQRWMTLMARGEELADGKDPAIRHQLEEIRAFYEFLEGEQAAILDRWEQRQRRRSP
jgi:DNA-binding transcriptional regulator GbsR (MarR family)